MFQLIQFHLDLNWHKAGDSMNINTKGNKAPNVTNLNPWGGVVNNEQPNTSKGFGGKTPSNYFGDTSNEQTANGKTFKGFSPNRGGIYDRLNVSSDVNEKRK